jgi:hypothetical protein
MGEEALVESQVADAIEFIKQLDQDGVSPMLAVWYFYDDAAEWRLILAGPSFDALLPKQEALAYRKVVDALSAVHLSSLAASDVKLIESKAPLARAIRMLIGTPPNATARAHFSNTTLNGLFIRHMIVLRSA